MFKHVFTNRHKSSEGNLQFPARLAPIATITLALSLGLAGVTTSSVANAQDPELEEIVVKGIRGSLESSVNIKRNTTGISDSIVAEDIGKFPDINVAESLQRITGVAITRTRGGEGQFATVRGLGEEFNAVTYNGRVLATENSGREFSFDVLASELISGADVFKTPTASQGDGSLGGRIDIRTRRPLDSQGFNLAVSAAGQYEDLSEETTPRATGLISWTNDQSTFGWNASLSYQEREYRTDVVEAISILNPGRGIQLDADGLLNIALDTDGDGLNDTTGAQITRTGVKLNALTAGLTQTESERIGGTFAAEWAPNDRTRFMFDVLYTELTNPSLMNGWSYFPSAQNSNNVGTGTIVNDRDQVLATTIQAFQLDLLTRRTEGEAETSQFGFNLEHAVNDRLTLTGDLSFSSSDGNRDDFGSSAGSGSFYVTAWAGAPRVSFDATGGPTNINISEFSVQNIEGDEATRRSIEALNGDDVRLAFARNSTFTTTDDVVNFQLDADWEISDNQSFKVGLDYVNREKTNRALDNSATWCATCGRPAVAAFDATLAANFLSPFGTGDFLSEYGGNVPRAFPVVTIADFEAARSAMGLLSELVTVTLDPNASADVEESVFGVYFEFDFSGDFGGIPYHANFGTRFAHTDLTSTGAGLSFDGIVASQLLRQPDGFAGSQTFTLNPSAGSSVDNDYFDVLPSVNVAFDLTDEVKFRLGASRSLSRPSLTDLGTQFSITSVNILTEAIDGGNPNLEAIRSNNFDASLEWYGDNAFASAAVFHKDITDFVNNGVVDQIITVPRTIVELDSSITDVGPTDIVFSVGGPQNGDTAEITGLELAGQWFHDSGFGVAGNVTLTDSESVSADGSVSTLENISDTSYNASVFYENYGLQARLSLNHRSDFLIGQTSEGGLDEYGDDFTQLDLSASYAVTDNFTVFLDGINITDEEIVRLSEFPDSDLLEYYEQNGTRWVIGARYNFGD